ncbi:helix-turn-helix domain-containing protein [Amycolatopsis thermophila]|uniref:DNA-binding XRE family transcriptional regulator n=1 Tax=Amycolatopsis thermophila TaxID=206084 RepID=A0ABU0EMV9_9PSEU|nr:helix-turn-helix domain-containing protein [Amycolatopsis thermophila]MDQ0376619.1 DNA-binding XRE family transcriptional regulator [Amycolatopsis thermophila]
MTVIALRDDDDNNFEYRRKRIGYTSQEIAAMLGVTYQTVRNMEHGRWSYHTADYDSLLTRLTDDRRQELNRELPFDQDVEEFKERMRERLQGDTDRGKDQ